MKRILLIATVASLAGCGAQPLVTNGDIIKHMEKNQYSKVLLRDDFSCGRMGNGKHFIATRDGKVRTGQVCYLKAKGEVRYTLDETSTLDPKAALPRTQPTPGATATPGSKLTGDPVRDFWNRGK
jgi:predicted small lipoprotein YifL